MLLQENFKDVSTVISILPVAIRETKPGLIPATYAIPAVKDPAKEVETLVVARATFPVYIDEHRPALVVPEPSDRVAFAICRDYRVSMSHVIPNISEPGLFWIKGALSSRDVLISKDAELVEALRIAREMQIEWFKLLIVEADDYWNKTHARRAISDIQRRAASFLGLDREWNIDMEVSDSLSTCKFCKEQIHPEAIICGHCQGILNMVKYKESFVKAGTTP